MNTKVKTMSLRATKWRGNLFRDCFVGILFLLAMTGYASPAFAGELANQFTISLWVNPLTSVASKALAVKNTEIRLYTDASGYASCAIHNGTDWQTAAADTAALSLNTWSFVSCSYDKVTLRLFVNGVQKGTSALTATVNDAATNWRVGSDEAGTYADLTGTTDEFKIYNYARTQKQIVEDMNGGHPAGGSPVGSQVGYWKFDEGYGTNANNSGNGSSLNGTITGATWSNSGKFGKALSFAGSTNSVSVGSIANVGTVSLWVNPSTNSQSLLALTAGAYISASSGVITATGFTSPTIYVNGKVSSTLTASVWNHVVVTTDTSITASALTIGRANSASLTGLIDEVKIYNYALTSDEVKLDYNQGVVMSLGAKGTNSSYAAGAENQTYCIPGDASTCSAPVGEWSFDEGSGSAVNDSSGNSNTGTATGTTIVSGKVGKARSFNGSSDYVGMSSGTNYANTQDHTYEAWVKYTSYPGASGYEWILDNGGSSTGTSLILRSPSSGTAAKIAFFYGGGSAVTIANTSLSLNAWYHVSAVYSATTNKVTFYLNGVDDGTSGTLNTWSGGTSVNNVGRWNQSGGIHYFTGSIDQVRIYNYARTPAQVAWDYNRGKPVGWWSFDDCSGSVANDRSENSNTGTISIGATGTQTAAGTCQSANTAHAWYNGASGKFNSSLNFDGTDDYVTPGNTNLTGLNDYTYSAWVNINTLPTSGNFQAILGVSNGDQVLSLFNNYSGYTGFGQISYHSGGAGSAVPTQGSLPSTSTWYHLAAVRNTSNSTVKLYVNGVQVASTAIGGAVAYYGTDPTINIGKRATSGNYFSGQIDDVRVYNYALTGTQVKTLFNDGGAVRFGP